MHSFSYFLIYDMSEKYSTIAVLSEQKLEESQAAEIIRRTDQFYCKLYSGNNHEFNRKLYKLSGIPADYEGIEKEHSCCDMDIRWMKGKDWNEQYETWEKWKKSWGCIDLHHLCNNWISSANLYGPCGWMSPDGEVGGYFSTGRYPSVEEVEEDLMKIAKEFPFLEFTAYMIDEIYDDKVDVDAEWKVSSGKVELIREDFSVDDVSHSGIQDTAKYKKHLSEAPDFENWWTLDELKELWKGHLVQER